MASVSNSDKFIRMVFGGLLDFQRRGVLCDTLLRAQGGEILAHSAIVAAASAKLKRELARVDSEPGTQHIVELPDFTTADVQRLLEYIYSGEAGSCEDDLNGVVALCETLEIPLPAAWSGQDVAETLGEGILKAEAEFLGDSVAAANDADLSLVVNKLYTQKDGSLGGKFSSGFITPDSEGNFQRYNCGTCGRQFKRLAALKLHEKSHIGESPARRKKLYGTVAQKTPDSGKTPQSAVGLSGLDMLFGTSVNGGSTSKLVGPYKPRHRVCNKCDAVFECSADLYAHRRREHTNLDDFMYVCDCCERRFQFPSTLIEHRPTHDDTVCETCNCQFRTYGELYRHRFIHHAAARAAGQRLFVCRVCGRAFPTKPELQQHRTSHLKCETCHRFFLKPSKLRRHAPSCGKRQEKRKAAEDRKKLLNDDAGSPDEGYLCTECGKTFEHKTSLISHKKAHVSDQFYENMYASIHYTCSTCGRAFPKPSRLRRHAIGCAVRVAKQLNIKVEELDNNETDEDDVQLREVTPDGFQCADCGRLFEKLASLASHKKVHAPPEFRCETCGKVFPKRYYLVTHERKHSNERPFACEHCGLCFKQPGQVQRHVLRRHSGGARPHMCDTCGRTFTVKSDLKDHERIHTGERAHMCDQCGRRFRTRGILRVHERQHTGVMPFSCAYCGRRFAQLSNKLKHEIIHTGAFPLRCEQCGRGFTDTSALRRHELYHSGLRPHACDVCGRAFALKNSLKSHVLIHSKVRQHVCPVCQKAFVLRNGLVRHLKIHVRNRGGRPITLGNITASYATPSVLPVEKKPVVSYEVAEDGDSADEVAYEPDVLHEMFIAENVVEVAIE